MAKTKISEFSTTAGNNTDINSINIAEGCAPSGINDAIRELMRQLKEFQTGGAGDSVNSGGDFSVATNKFTVASATGNTAVAGTLAVTGVATLTAQPILSSLTASKAVFTDGSKGLVSNDVTGTGNVVMSNSPTLVAPALGTPASGVVTNLTGTASININGTVGATTPSTGAFTTLSSTGNTTLGDADTDTLTFNASFVTGTTLKSAKLDTNTLSLAAYDVDGTAYTNLVTLTAGNTPTLALTSTGVGTINNMSIGATTASTGAFTTLSASGAVTLSGGTANGVAYLNGSKVVTTGSALTFDGTNGGTSGIWSAGNIVSTSGGYVRVNRSDNATYNEIKYATGDLFYFNQANGGAYQFNISGSEQMRLTSTGLGIGTSSPTANLTVAGGTHLRGYTAPNTSFASLVLGITGGEAYIQPYTTGLTQIPLNVEGSTVKINTGGSTRATLDASGNLGLGVTPSAWSLAGLSALQIKAAAMHGYDSECGLTANGYYASGSWRYIGSTFATQYLQSGGVHRWYTAPSGTAGNAISFTQAMTLDSSGNLLMGKASLTDTGAGFAFGGGSNAGLSYFARSSGIVMSLHRYTTTGDIVRFVYDGTPVGTISVTGSATAYNTSSDYRLKNIDGPLTGSGAFIDALKPKVGTWKADGSKFVGFIAHEVQEVSPGSVTGEKDGEEMQAMEYGSAEFIANIIAELQTLRARVAALES